MLKTAGIKVWVLTGDKIETAVNIGFSSGLLDNEMHRFYVTEHDLPDILNEINQIETELPKFKALGQKLVLVLAGDSLL